MKQLTLAGRKLARQLLAHEAGQSSDLEIIAEASERVCSKLRGHLTPLVGLEGYLALLMRALTMAKHSVQWLSPVEVMPDGNLDGLQKAATVQELDGASEGYVIFLAHILDLLIIFIGEGLTIRFLNEVWPEITMSSSYLESKERHNDEFIRQS